MSEKLSHRRSMVQLALLGSIGAYRRVVSPLLPSACRFYPSCSAYASEAIAAHGALRGMALAVERLLRCHPWCEGGVDPVPSRESCAHGADHAARVMKGHA